MANKNLYRKIFVDCIPVMSGYIVLGIGFGILLRKAGYGLPWAMGMSIFIYAGSMQYVMVSLLSQSASILTTALTALMVNARHLFYGISMIDRYKDNGRMKPATIFLLTDETYSLVCRDLPEGMDKKKYYLGVSCLNYFYWNLGSVLGSLLGAVIPFNTAGIEFSMTALFVSVFVEQWLSTKNHLPALTGLLASAVSLVIFGSSRFLIPAMILITLILLLSRNYNEGRTGA